MDTIFILLRDGSIQSGIEPIGFGDVEFFTEGPICRWISKIGDGSVIYWRGRRYR